MADIKIVIGNKNYSSWSLRGWLAVRQSGLDFEEIVIPLDRPDTKEAIRRHSPSGRVPALIDGDLTIWDCLAIIEYLAEKCPEAGLWPADRTARAVARAASAEMHADFTALRQHLPMNIRSRFPGRDIPVAVQEQINRITASWRDCRAHFGGTGPFLFGEWSAADAMYAPVVTRFQTYGIDLDETAAAYCRAVRAHPAMADWTEAATDEPWIIESAEF